MCSQYWWRSCKSEAQRLLSGPGSNTSLLQTTQTQTRNQRWAVCLFQDNLCKGHTRIIYASEKEWGGGEQILFHSPNITAVGLTRLSPDITLSSTCLSTSISYLISRKKDWHLVHSAFQQNDICIFILTWPNLGDTRLSSLNQVPCLSPSVSQHRPRTAPPRFLLQIQAVRDGNQPSVVPQFISIVC